MYIQSHPWKKLRCHNVSIFMASQSSKILNCIKMEGVSNHSKKKKMFRSSFFLNVTVFSVKFLNCKSLKNKDKYLWNPFSPHLTESSSFPRRSCSNRRGLDERSYSNTRVGWQREKECLKVYFRMKSNSPIENEALLLQLPLLLCNVN